MDACCAEMASVRVKVAGGEARAIEDVDLTQSVASFKAMVEAAIAVPAASQSMCCHACA